MWKKWQHLVCSHRRRGVELLLLGLALTVAFISVPIPAQMESDAEDITPSAVWSPDSQYLAL